MPITINTNVSAMISQRNLASSSARSASSLAKLSSGSRVPSAKEDAASLAVGTGLKLDVTALKAAQVNAQQATSMLQIADGAFGQIGDILNRMKSLATTSQSGQLSDTERSYLNDEYNNLTNEINRISASTNFNGVELLGTQSDLSEGAAGANYNAANGFVATSISDVEANANDTFGVFYDDTAGTVTLTNVTQGKSQSVLLGATGDDPVTTGQTKTLEFSSLGVEITLSDDFGSGANIGAIGNLGAAGGTDANFQFDAVATGVTGATSLNFQVGIDSSANSQISVSLAQGSFQALVDDASASAFFTDPVSTTLTGVGSDTDAAIATVQVDAAVFSVNTARASIGANMNRLEFANSNLSVTIENTEAARSTLMDVDVSAEITKFSSEQVLIQAGVSMLAQANQQPSLLLRLLQ